jgi:hypothetical protein
MATMTPGHWFSLAAVVLAAASAVVLYQWGDVGESVGGWQTRANLEASIEAQRASSLRRQTVQRISFGLILLSGVCALVALFLP